MIRDEIEKKSTKNKKSSNKKIKNQIVYKKTNGRKLLYFTKEERKWGGKKKAIGTTLSFRRWNTPLH